MPPALCFSEADKGAGIILPPSSYAPLPHVHLHSVAGADVETLRKRLIDALESHSDTWPPACPPLEPARYSGLDRLGAVWARITGLVARGQRGQLLRGYRGLCLWGIHLCGPEPRAALEQLVEDFLLLEILPEEPWLRGTNRGARAYPAGWEELGRRSPGHTSLCFSQPVLRNVWGVAVDFK